MIIWVYTTDKISINKQLESINTELRVWSDRKFNVFERLTGNGLFLQHFHMVVPKNTMCCVMQKSYMENVYRTCTIV